MNLQTSIQYLKGVGEKRAALLRRLDIRTVGDLLAHVPRAYEDWQTVYPIAGAPLGVPCCVRAIVGHAPVEHMLRGGMTLYKTRVTDGASMMHITIFNSSYAAEKLKEGKAYLFYGRILQNNYAREMSSPQIANTNEDRLRPVYPLTEGISSRMMETLVNRAMELTLSQVKEFLPEEVLQAYALLPRQTALQLIHMPGSIQDSLEARRRLAFNELFLLQMGLRLLRTGKEDERALPLSFHALDEYYTKLPFELTGAQRRSIKEAAEDMSRGPGRDSQDKLGLQVAQQECGETPVRIKPMRRLLQGDVGSGKTAVAAALLHIAAQGGAQAAVMAPTELLARQHYDTLGFLGLEPALLIGATPAAEKKKIKAGLANGGIPLVVGTHALLQDDIIYAKLALVVIDEQHRFGVEQRDRLADQEMACHQLVMSATPIPRSLAMVIYGDLDISVLDELPPGRTPVETYCVAGGLRTRAYAYIKKHLDQGRQGYLVCPRVATREAQQESGELVSAQALYKELCEGEFSRYRLGLLHGKLKPRQKEQVMAAFAAGETQLLVSTTVVEVGIDVPNAVIMVVENAERFGLSQLHQLRGRVGRGAASGTCILISDAESEEAQARFAIMKETADGFEIARRDLELRGPGQFFGARQHGLPELKIADIAADMPLLEETRAAVRDILQQDPALAKPEHRAMRRACEKLIRTKDAD